jgi:hypothetical protein
MRGGRGLEFSGGGGGGGGDLCMCVQTITGSPDIGEINLNFFIHDFKFV